MKIFIGILMLLAALIFFAAKKILTEKNPDDEIEKNYVNRVMSRYKN